MHSDWLNHYFFAAGKPTPPGAEDFPQSFPTAFTSPGSSSSVPIPHGTTVLDYHLIAIPHKAATSRFYLLGGCDTGAILHRPQFMAEQHISPATPMHRQYGAQVLAVGYLMHG